MWAWLYNNAHLQVANLWLWDLDLASVPASHLRALAATVSFSVTLAKVEAVNM